MCHGNIFSRGCARLIRTRGSAAALLALVVIACTAAAAATIRAQRMIAPGVSYSSEGRYTDAPLSINVIVLDPRQQFISLVCAAPDAFRRLAVSEFAGAASSPQRYAVAAINGDYFVRGSSADGALLGVNIRAGELVSARAGRSALVVLEGGIAQVAVLRLDARLETAAGRRIPVTAINQPRGRDDVALYTPAFGTSTRTPPSGREVALQGLPQPLELGKVYEAQVAASTHAVGNLVLAPGVVVVSAAGAAAAGLENVAVGDTVKLCVDMMPHLQGKILEAIGGGPRLLRDGRVSVEWAQEGFASGHAQQRHPRTAAGIRPDGHVVLVTVDGRQACSVGMTLDELAQLMLELGCRDAVNLDGGGSTTMWVRGAVVNSPCEGRQRPVGNALLVMSSAPQGPATHVRLTPESITALPGYRVTISVEAQDDYYNPVGFSTTGLGWACEGGVGAISPRGEFTAGEVTENTTGAVKVYLAGATAQVPVTVYARPPGLRISPQVVSATPGQRMRFAVTPVDEQERPIAFDPAQVRWQVDASAGVMEEAGVLTVGSGPTGRVTANLLGVEAAARVVLATAAQAVANFENTTPVGAYAWPREVPATAERVTAPVREGKYAARLSYDFATTTATRAAYLNVDRDAGNAVALRAWVYGDERGHWLRARITDAAGQHFNLDLAPRVDWSGWREVRAFVPPEAAPPIRWDAVYVSEFRPERQDAGALVFDLLQAEVASAMPPL